jgi:hypothetical protein
MATIETAHANDWPDLHSLLDEYFTHYDGYIFRGQADAQWSVDSTLTRALARLGTPSERVEEKVAGHLQRFKEQVRGRSRIDLQSSSDDTMWSLGQHYGLYTPLLDWSRSPYVALYFSLLGSSASGTRALYALVEADVSDISVAFSKSDEVQIVKPLSHENVRIVSQGGLFLKLPVGESLVGLVEKTPECGWVTLYKITYPDSIKNDALAALNNMNINHASLFPDLVGSSQHANFLLEIDPHLERGREEGFQRGRTEA